MKPSSAVPFSLRLDPKVRARLDAEAVRHERSASYLVTKAIESYLDSEDEKRRAIEEALSAADRGEFISSRAMNDWINSWGTPAEAPPPRPDRSRRR